MSGLKYLRDTLKDLKGVTAIEYALIGGFIAVLIVVGAKSIGTELSSTFNHISSSI